MKPLASNKTIPKFRIVLSIPDMEAILSALSKDTANVLENVELIGWITKQKRKAEFGVMEASHSSGPSTLSKRVETLAQEVLESSAKQFYQMYKDGDNLGDDAMIIALEYKAEHVLECGSLTLEESQVLNEAMTKKLLGGL
jgi:hypothetical protein